MPQWLSENIFSIIILIVTAAVIGLLIYSMIRTKKAARASGKPACYGCPYAKKCNTGAASCSCNTKNMAENGENSSRLEK